MIERTIIRIRPKQQPQKQQYYLLGGTRIRIIHHSFVTLLLVVQQLLQIPSSCIAFVASSSSSPQITTAAPNQQSTTIRKSSSSFSSTSSLLSSKQEQQQHDSSRTTIDNNYYSPNNDDDRRVIPITVLSGFLGSGKTTVLQNLLQNKDGLKIGLVVNDVASINIDSKLVSRYSTINRINNDNDLDNRWNEANERSSGSNTNTNNNIQIIELQNGCACCSKSDELLTSIAELVTLNDLRDYDNRLDHIVVEMSGVADPIAVRNNFQEAYLFDMPLLQRIRLDTMITVLDVSTYLQYIQSTKYVTRVETPELFTSKTTKSNYDDDDDHSDYDAIPMELRQQLGLRSSVWDDDDDDEVSSTNGVAALLTSQTEIADVIIMNKMDLLQPKEDDDDDNTTNDAVRIQEIIKAFNPKATIIQSTYGNVPYTSIIGIAGGKGMAQSGIIDDHRDTIEAATTTKNTASKSSIPSHHHHSHDPSDPNDEDHHSHDHGHGCTTTDGTICNDPTHDHTHSHVHTDGTVCTDPTHDHSHSPIHADGTICTDPTHDHSHTHEHTNTNEQITINPAGIGTYVYTARRPFHPQRLYNNIIQYLPLKQVGSSDERAMESETDNRVGKKTKMLKNVLRSKGFVWFASSNIMALYWSHAGINLDVSCLGAWWATLPRNQWPVAVIDSIVQDFDNPDHSDDNGNDTVGDRRQELVLIGPSLGDRTNQQILDTALNECLVTDDEYRLYQQNRKSERSLSEIFPNPYIQIQMMT